MRLTQNKPGASIVDPTVRVVVVEELIVVSIGILLSAGITE